MARLAANRAGATSRLSGANLLRVLFANLVRVPESAASSVRRQHRKWTGKRRGLEAPPGCAPFHFHAPSRTARPESDRDTLLPA